MLSVPEHPARLTKTMKISENCLTPTLSPKTRNCILAGNRLRCPNKAKYKKHSYITLNSVLLLTSAANDKESIIICPPSCHFSSKIVAGSNKVDKIKTPTIIIQGDNDERVPLSESIQMYEKLVQNETPSELVRFSDEGHGVVKRKNQIKMYQRIFSFLKSNGL